MPRRRSQRPHPEPTPTRPAAGPDVQSQLADIQRQLIELRELVIELLQHHGFERAGARGVQILRGGEEKIPLSDAVELVWGRSAAQTPESVENHTGILRLFATKGVNGAVLETEFSRGRWFTSREAVQRFMAQAFGQSG